MPLRPPFTEVLESLPATVPFVAPDALERRRGRPIQVRLGANESSFGVSPRAAHAMVEAVAGLWKYADPEAWDLRTELAHRNGVSLDNVVVGAGIDDLLGLVVRSFVAPGTPVVMSLGGYPTFRFHVAGYGGALHTVPYQDDRNDLPALLDAAIAHRARLLYLANPDNPSGSWVGGETVARFAAELPEGCLLVLDEAYAEFAPPWTMPQLGSDDPQVIRLRTFSKAHGMAGARIGYALASRELIAAFDRIRLHFGVNGVAQAGALASLGDPGFVAGVVEEVASGRREYQEGTDRLGLHALPSATNFVTIDVGGVERARALVEALLRRDVFIRMPGAPPLDRCVRVSVGRAEERREFLERLEEALGDLPPK